MLRGIAHMRQAREHAAAAAESRAMAAAADAAGADDSEFAASQEFFQDCTHCDYLFRVAGLALVSFVFVDLLGFDVLGIALDCFASLCFAIGYACCALLCSRMLTYLSFGSHCLCASAISPAEHLSILAGERPA